MISRRLLSLSVIACTVVSAATAVAAPRSKAQEPVAVWPLMAEDEDRALAEHWFGKIAAAIDTVDGVVGDAGRVFGPAVQPAEGVVVAIETAGRWLDASWLAHSRREWTSTLGLADDALALVAPYPASRLPLGLRRDLMLQRARAMSRLDRAQDARDALRQAMFLDPTWEALPRWEHAELVALYEAVQAERAGVPSATIRVSTDVRGAKVLVSGIPRGDTRTGPLDLELPAGTYEIAATKAGHTVPIETIAVRPRQELEVSLPLVVRNTAAFQEQLRGALADPASARTSDVWEGLRLANEQVGARGVLTARFVRTAGTDGGTLEVGLYLPGRRGWAFYREVRLARDGRDDFRVGAVITDLELALDTALRPLATDEVASR